MAAMEAHRLLVVDDSLIMRSRIVRLCTKIGQPGINVVGLAANGKQALELARERSPTLVTMDLTMPEMDGEACIEQLACLLPETRILVVSALSDKTTALRAMQRGAHGFILKPFRDDELTDALLDLME
jgi:two-component system chemotaxis response regulator CheY